MRPTMIAVLAILAFGGCGGTPTPFVSDMRSQTAARVTAEYQPVAKHHLYVAGAPFLGSGTYGLQRFPIVDGKPAKNPDLVYPDASGPIAVGLDGSLYAADDLRFQTIDRFVPGSIKPASRLVAAPCGHGYLYAGLSTFTFDAKGDLYVAIIEGTSGARALQEAGCPDELVAVYAPGATGRARPINKVDIGLAVSGELSAMAIDSNGDLAVVTGNAVRVYTDPTAKTRLARLFASRALPFPQGIAFDPGHPVVYLSNSSPAAVVVLPADAQGPTRPNRLIKNAAAKNYCGQIALLGAFIFVADATTDTVYEFRKDEHGSPKPFASVSVPFAACGVAVD
jgi:hypothetical protein